MKQILDKMITQTCQKTVRTKFGNQSSMSYNFNQHILKQRWTESDYNYFYYSNYVLPNFHQPYFWTWRCNFWCNQNKNKKNKKHTYIYVTTLWLSLYKCGWPQHRITIKLSIINATKLFMKYIVLIFFSMCWCRHSRQ